MEKFQVTDSRGKTFRRDSREHYTHAVVVHMRAASIALWRRSEAHAQEDAALWSKFGHVVAVEIIPVSAP